MAYNERLYPFGYIFSDEKNENIPENFTELKVCDKYYYAFDDKLKENFIEKDGKFLIIHGEFIHIGIDNQYTNQGLTERLFSAYFFDHNVFLELLDFIAGRFVIIIGDLNDVKIYPDASNSRSNYYSITKNAVASHVSLLNAHGDYKRVKYGKELPELKNALLETPFSEIKSAIPNFYIDFYRKKQHRFFPRENNKYTSLDEDTKFQLIERFWKLQLDYYTAKYKNLLFSLTGGGDSRFSLALTKDYLERIHFFTYSRTSGVDESSQTAIGLTMDYNIVTQMLEVMNINHKFIYFVEDKIDLSEKDNNLISKNSIGRHSSFLIPQIKANYKQDNLMHIRGNLLEIGKTRYYRNVFRESNLEEMRKVFINRYAKNVSDDTLKLANEKYDEFIDNLNYDNKVFDYHLLDLYHWEIRMGRWHSEILNTHDIVFGTISPFNHRALIDLTLSFSYEKRRDEYAFKEIINRNYPILNFFGDNDLKNMYEQSRKKYDKEQQ